MASLASEIGKLRARQPSGKNYFITKYVLALDEGTSLRHTVKQTKLILGKDNFQ